MATKLTTFAAHYAPKQRFGDLRVGWTVRVHQKLKQKDKAKNQIFEGIIIAHKHGNEPGATITVRKVSGGIGVEKIIPLRLPSIEKIEVVKTPRVRRAKLYYLREKSAKQIRKKMKNVVGMAVREDVPPAQEPEQEEPTPEVSTSPSIETDTLSTEKVSPIEE